MSSATEGPSGTRKLIPVGFWKDPEDEATRDFADPHDLVDKRWDRAERKRVVAYLRGGTVVATWHGYASCRFHCWTSPRKLGSRDFSDGVYIWPEGFAHYVDKHHVRPPEDFLDHVRGRLGAAPDAARPRI